MARRRKGTVRKLLINAKEPEESRIAILHGGRLDEYYIERQSLGSTLGNIYKAKITNVEKSIGAAFVEFGHSRQGFLHVSDLSMEAVGEEARELLVGVQAAREVAHDEDVVEPARRAAPARREELTEEAAAPQAAPSPEAPPEGAGTVQEPGAAAEPGEAGPEEEEEEEEEYPSEDLVASWEGEEAERGEGVAALSETEDEDESVSLPDAVDLEDEDDDDEDEDDDEDDDEVEDGAQPAGVAEIGADDGAALSSRDLAEDEGEEEEDDEGEQQVAAEAGAEGSREGGAAPARRGRRRGGRGRRRGRGAQAQEAQDAAPEAEVEVEAEAEGEGDDGGERKDDGSGRRRGRRGGRRRRGGGNGGGNGGGSSSSGRRTPRQMPPIEDLLQKGQEIVVQVIKEGIGTKGPTLTTFLSIPGRFIVLMPGIRKRGVSRKVTNNAERERLKSIVRNLECPDELGFIVRTAGSGCSREDLQRDLDYLLRLWNQMQVRIKEHRAPVLLYQENNLVIRTLRDLYDGQGEIVIDEPATADRAREFLGQILPECVEKVQTYESDKPLFSHYGLETELHRLLQNRVELKSGGSLIIEQTEALVAIDVNSGRFKPTSHKNIDDTAFQVNSEAAVEVARQLRLRDLGGVVIIDFIDMRQEKHRKQLERLFKEELRKDRARLKLSRFSPFGILELTRQRVRPSLKRTVHQKCPYCEGTGFIPSDETSCLGVVRKVRENLWRPGSVLYVTVRPEVAEAVLNTQRQTLAELERSSGKSVFIRADHRLAYDEIEVKAMIALPGEVDHRRA